MSLILEEPRARKRDPETSKAAAVSAKHLKAVHADAIVACLIQYGALGKDGIAARTRLTGVQICRRLVELEREGRAMPTGKTVQSTSGREEREWRACA